MAEGGSNAVVVNEEHVVMIVAGLPGPGGHSRVLKINSNTQHMSASVAIEFHRSALARSRVGAPPKIRFFRILYLPEMEVASSYNAFPALILLSRIRNSAALWRGPRRSGARSQGFYQQYIT